MAACTIASAREAIGVRGSLTLVRVTTAVWFQSSTGLGTVAALTRPAQARERSKSPPSPFLSIGPSHSWLLTLLSVEPVADRSVGDFDRAPVRAPPATQTPGLQALYSPELTELFQDCRKPMA